MKVLVLTSSFPRTETSHEVRYIFDLADCLTRQGWDLFILTPHYSGGKRSESWGNVSITRFPYFFPERYEKLAYGYGILYNLQNHPVAILNIPFFLLSEIWNSLRIIRSKKIDLVHTHWFIPQGFIGALLRFFLNIPHVATVHGSDLNTMKENRLLRWLIPFIVRNSDLITVNSRFMKSQLESVVPAMADRIKVIPMGIYPEKFGNPLDSGIKARKKTGNTILSVGRLIDLKGTKYLIDAIPKVLSVHSDTVLKIIGDGPERALLEKQARDLGIEKHIVFSGIINPPDLPPYYHSADVFVLPSIVKDGKTEGLGVVLLEAMASGVPVIGSNVGGIPDIIRDGENGFLVPEKDSATLAKKIIELLSSKDLADKFRTNGLLCVWNNFSWEKISGDFYTVYDQIRKQRE